MNAIEIRGRRRTGASAAATLLALALLVAGCSKDQLLNVNDPAVLLPAQINSAAGLPDAYAGALSDLTLSYSGSGGGPLTEGMINISGLFTDEFTISETFPDRIDIDRHTINVASAPELTLNFRQLHKARVAAEQAAADYAKFDPNNARHAEVLDWAGYTYLMFAENFCSGVPFSSMDLQSGKITFGDPATTAQMYDTAIARFTAALAVSGAGANEKALGNLGLARALLGSGQFAAAAAAAANVPSGFVYKLRHSSNSTRENNGVWSFNRSIGRWTVSDKEGGVGLPFRSQADVRTPFARDTIGGKPAVGFDKTTFPLPLYYSVKYATRDSSSVLASGIEARLIEAEAALQAGDAATWLSKLNALRATIGLPALSDPGTADARTDLHFQERAWWLQLTAHRLGDIRREVKYFNKPTSALYPSGTYYRGGTYGSDLVLPVPFDETNNPHFTQCLDKGV